jgi:hypothetical protein
MSRLYKLCGKMVRNYELGNICKEMVLTYFNTLSRSLSGRTEKREEKLLKRADFEPKAESRTSQLRNRYHNSTWPIHHAKPDESRYTKHTFILLICGLYNDPVSLSYHPLPLTFMFNHTYNGTSVIPTHVNLTVSKK